MKISATCLIVLAELAIGSAMFAALQDSKQIRKSYFEFCSGLSAAVFLAVSIWQAPLISPFVLSFLLAVAALGHFWKEHFFRGRMLLKGAGLFAITFGISALAAGSGFLKGIPSGLAWLFLVQLAAGALLLGGVHGAMVLGHWYLIMHKLDFSHLRRASVVVAALIAGRALLLVATLLWLRHANPLFAHSFISPLLDSNQDLFFFSMRIFWGLVLPGALAWMIWRCAKSGSNQSATGLLYLAEVSVLIGETMAVYLKI
jgi:hypothetical protein